MSCRCGQSDQMCLSILHMDLSPYHRYIPHPVRLQTTLETAKASSDAGCHFTHKHIDCTSTISLMYLLTWNTLKIIYLKLPSLYLSYSIVSIMNITHLIRIDGDGSSLNMVHLHLWVSTSYIISLYLIPGYTRMYVYMYNICTIRADMTLNTDKTKAMLVERQEKIKRWKYSRQRPRTNTRTNSVVVTSKR